MKLTLIAILTLFILPAGGIDVNASVRVVASTADLASIAQMVGGDKIKVESIANGKSDPHFVEVLPSYMVKVARADIYLKVGLDIDGWADNIIDGSGNGKLLIVDCSQDIGRLEVPKTAIDASMGDVHTKGNPHYWLDPVNGHTIAETITRSLKQVDGENSAYYDSQLAAFKNDLAARIVAWKKEAEPIDGMEIIAYHNSWPYFCRAFGVNVVAFIEPKPGIEPTASHTATLIELIRTRGIKLIGKEPYFSDRTPKTIARQTDARVFELPTSVKGVKGADDYFSLFDTLISTMKSAGVQ